MDTYTVTTVSTNNAMSPMVALLYLALGVLSVVALWKVFTKAGEAGWKSLIPFYNLYTMFRISGRNGWWMLALFIPLVNIVIAIRLALDIAKHFGKSTVFAIFGLILFSYVGWFMLAFGEAEYVGAKHS